jgi:hypothetical protein
MKPLSSKEIYGNWASLLLATGIRMGANGAYSNMACLNPFAAP